ncbi:MAG: sulfite exporter TauE/SafE family protein [Rubricoccaceae bacterium]|nr:sulfite exporter TauE/SafE family protein [Rubricoccaceae bacterium]
MPDPASLDLAVVFLVGLLGSAHCVGMCGGLVAAVAHGRGGAVGGVQAQYFLGKTLAYAALGALAGLAGGALGIVLAGVQGLISVALGLVLIGVGLALCGAFRVLGPTRLGQAVTARLYAPIGRLLASDRRGALAALGALNGLLPCGLVYAMLAKAATTGSAAAGALTLAVFGVATLPALSVVGWLGGRVPAARRVGLQRAGGVLVVALGVLTLARSAVAFALLDPALLPGGEAILCH